MNTSIKISAIGLGVGALTLLALTVHFHRKRKINQKKPKASWQLVGKLLEIDLYPLKSSRALSLEEATCDSFGLTQFGFRDRSLVLVSDDDDQRIASVGKYPTMLSINIKILGDKCLYLTAPHVEPLTLNLKDFDCDNRFRFTKNLKGFSLELTEGSSKEHEWFSQVILNKEKGLRLFLSSVPKIERKWWRSASEYMPVMVMHEKSVKELNSKLLMKNRVHQQQFRGNLLVDSLENIAPQDEDNWLWLKIGQNDETATILRFNSACLRCIIPNIDIFSSKRNEDFEPLKTLKKYRIRSHPKEPEMGVYFDVYQEGKVKCGDPVYVQYK